jgi:hypothetical protein
LDPKHFVWRRPAWYRDKIYPSNFFKQDRPPKERFTLFYFFTAAILLPYIPEKHTLTVFTTLVSMHSFSTLSKLTRLRAVLSAARTAAEATDFYLLQNAQVGPTYLLTQPIRELFPGVQVAGK